MKVTAPLTRYFPSRGEELNEVVWIRSTVVHTIYDLWIGEISGPNQEQYILPDPKTVADCSDTKEASAVNALTVIVFTVDFFGLTGVFMEYAVFAESNAWV